MCKNPFADLCSHFYAVVLFTFLKFVIDSVMDYFFTTLPLGNEKSTSSTLYFLKNHQLFLTKSLTFFIKILIRP